MRLRLGKLILLAMTILMLYVLLVNGFPSFIRFFKRPDGIHPKPSVELELRCVDGSSVIVRDGSAEKCLLGKSFTMKVRLINKGVEPSLRADTASAVLIVLEGARFSGYVLGDFDRIIGVTWSGGLREPIGSRIIEIFSTYIGGGEVREAYFNVTVDNVEKLRIEFRGWIIDEDDKVWNPVDKVEENYYARYPEEDPVNNPPDSRWCGKDFMKYKMYNVTIPVVE